MFFRPIPLVNENTIKITKASIVLHNLLQRQKEEIPQEPRRQIEALQPQDEVTEAECQGNAKDIRDKFCTYYNHIGPVAWQDKMINDTNE